MNHDDRPPSQAETSGETVTVWFDGACEPINPGGHGTYGVVVERGDQTVHEQSGYLGQGEDMTNNVAEYEAVIAALEHVQRAHHDASITIYGDSELVIRQLNGEYAVRSDRLRPRWRAARQLATGLEVVFEWVPSEENERADALSRRAYHEQVESEAIAERRARADSESMSITALGDHAYTVKGRYTVDLTGRTCTCPDFEHRGLPCKHILAVEQERSENGG